MSTQLTSCNYLKLNIYLSSLISECKLSWRLLNHQDSVPILLLNYENQGKYLGPKDLALVRPLRGLQWSFLFCLSLLE